MGQGLTGPNTGSITCEKFTDQISDSQLFKKDSSQLYWLFATEIMISSKQLIGIEPTEDIKFSFPNALFSFGHLVSDINAKTL
jgi:hypothetical protein